MKRERKVKKKELTSLDHLQGEEFRMKVFTLHVFFTSSLSYLVMTIVRGKGSLPYWVQIPTMVLYTIMEILVRIFGNDINYYKFFNKAIPLFVLSMYFPTLLLTNMEAYDSEVIWGFCLTLIFTLFQMFSLLYSLKFKLQLVMTCIGLICMLINIERQSQWAQALRFETYPYVICCVLGANYISAQLWKIKGGLINELKS